MLRIRFSRTGKVGQPSFRIVVSEHRAPVKGRYLEMLGHYTPTAKKEAVIQKERITYWISKGAIPSDSAAALFKQQGMPEMDRYLAPRNRKRAPKGEEAQAKPQQAKPEQAAATQIPAAQ